MKSSSYRYIEHLQLLQHEACNHDPRRDHDLHPLTPTPHMIQGRFLNERSGHHQQFGQPTDLGPTIAAREVLNNEECLSTDTKGSSYQDSEKDGRDRVHTTARCSVNTAGIIHSAMPPGDKSKWLCSIEVYKSGAFKPRGTERSG